MGLVLISRAPRMFPVLWTLISPFIDENTRRKFMINSNENVKKELETYVIAEYLPDFLGGSATLAAPSGGHVPKSRYLPMPEAVADEDNVLASTYTVATAQKGAPIEVLVPVKMPGSGELANLKRALIVQLFTVLTWDIDMIKGVCEFTLYHTPKVSARSPT